MILSGLRSLLKKSKVINDLYARYQKRRDIYRIKKSIRKTNSIKIVFGASGVFDEGWIPTDRSNLDLLDNADWEMYFKPDSIDAMLAEHVLEHLTVEDASIALKNCFKYLKKGGYFRIAVPDGCHSDSKYIDQVKVGGFGLGSDDHKVLYTYKTLKEILENAGFMVNFLEHFDEDGEFHFVGWRPEQGKIHRSKYFDSRNHDGLLNYTSIIVDAYKQ